METLKKTCLYESHIALGARMSPFGGFMMPIQYSDIIQEHNAVRTHCGMFDVSHMGEIFVSGPEAGDFVNHIFTNDVSVIPPGKILYGMMLYPDGGVVDDLLVYRMPEPQTFLLVVNAANIAKDYEWICKGLGQIRRIRTDSTAGTGLGAYRIGSARSRSRGIVVLYFQGNRFRRRPCHCRQKRIHG